MSDSLAIRAGTARSVTARAGPFLRAVAVLMAALAVGVASVVLPVRLLAVGATAIAVVVVSVARPAIGAYMILLLTPLLAGIDRGGAIPFLRPSEAVTALVGVGVLFRRIAEAFAGAHRLRRPSRLDVAVVTLCVTASVLPLLWMLARGNALAGDDVLYAVMLWKFGAIYFVFRMAIRTPREVRVCLWIAMAVGTLVAAIAILQSIGVGAVTSFVARYYANYGNTQAVANNRGGATLGLPIAAADLLMFDLAIAAGFLIRRERSGRDLGVARAVASAMAVVFVIGVIASGEFSALIGLLVAFVTLAIVTRRSRLLVYVVPAAAIAAMLLRPVIARRLEGFSSVSGLPVSWLGRLHNLQSYFWPELFSNWRFVLGVRPAARVIVPTQATGFVWIESGYTWLLWSGGIPLLIAFGWFAYATIRRGAAVWHARDDAIAVAALASLVAMVVVAVLMTLDPHLTYRGAADLLFALIAIAGTRTASDRAAATARTERRA